MTGVPEATLTREVGLCFATVTVVVNWGAGLMSEAINFNEARAASDRAKRDLLTLFLEVLSDPSPYPPCACAGAVNIIGSSH
jgi:5'-methylthioadenosine phosphorylase